MPTLDRLRRAASELEYQIILDQDAKQKRRRARDPIRHRGQNMRTEKQAKAHAGGDPLATLELAAVAVARARGWKSRGDRVRQREACEAARELLAQVRADEVYAEGVKRVAELLRKAEK